MIVPIGGGFLNHGTPCLLKFFLQNVCVCVPTYIPIYVCPYSTAHVSKFLSGKYSLYTYVNDNEEQPGGFAGRTFKE